MKNINEELLEFYSQDENYDFVEFWFSGIDEKSSKDCIIEFLEVTKNWNVKKKKASKLLYSTAKPYSKDTIFEILIKNNLKIYEETVTKTLPKHRDHFVHSAYVYLLGLYFYKKIKRFRESVDLAFKNNLPFGTNDNAPYIKAFQFRWTISSIFHDVGYPVEIASKQINWYLNNVFKNKGANGDNIFGFELNRFKELISFEYLSPIDSLIDQQPPVRYDGQYIKSDNVFEMIACNLSYKFVGFSYETLHNVLVECFKDNMNRGIIDHGIMGCIILANWIHKLYLKRKINPEYFYCHLGDCLGAIALHTADKWLPEVFKKRVKMEKHPIAYLLILCDELQEWFRPSGVDLEADEDFMSQLNDFQIECNDESVDIFFKDKESSKTLIQNLESKISPCIVKMQK